MLTIRDLTYVYPNGTRALDGVTLELAPGMFGLLGPNGAGKSTLMRCLATLQVPNSGSIRFDGLDGLIGSMTKRVRCNHDFFERFNVANRCNVSDDGRRQHSG